MSTLVEHQGGLVDRIETQVSSAREYAEEGVQQTKEALEHHRSFIKASIPNAVRSFYLQLTTNEADQII